MVGDGVNATFDLSTFLGNGIAPCAEVQSTLVRTNLHTSLQRKSSRLVVLTVAYSGISNSDCAQNAALSVFFECRHILWTGHMLLSERRRHAPWAGR